MAQYIPLILFTVFTNFGSQILLKKGMTSIEHFELTSSQLFKTLPLVIINPYIIMGILLMMISMGTHLVVLSKVEISYAYPFLGLSFVLIALYGHYALSEDLNVYRVTGVLSIIIGVIFVSRS